MRPPTDRRRRTGFTLIELLVVILILGILIALLVPAISGAIKTTRNAAVIAEINQLTNALAQFKTKYGDYPPSRIFLAENGDFSSSATNTGIARAYVIQRSVNYMRRFFPQFQVSTSPAPPALYTTASGWPDFNGNGTLDSAYVIQGHECLVFFLGGIPQAAGTNGYAMTGFAKNPINPFDSKSQNRNTPFYEFNAGRLLLDPTRASPSGIPGYLDSLGSPNTITSWSTGQPLNFYAYFSAYGNNNYDPEDVSFPEQVDDTAGYVIGALKVSTGYPTGLPGNLEYSTFPNPYTSTNTTSATSPFTLAYQKPSTFQILSAGADGLYGPGGQYTPTGGTALPYDSTNVPYYVYSAPPPPPPTTTITTQGLRNVEKDNLTNFATSKLD